MTVETKDPSGMPETSASGEPQEKSRDKVAYETYRKTKKEVDLYKSKVAEQSERLKNYELLEEQAEQKRLEDAGNYQKANELREAKFKELEANYQNLQRDISDSKKLQSVLTRLPTELENPDYASFIKYDDVVVNPETGEVDEESAEAIANDFIKRHHKLLKPTTKSRLPNEAASGSMDAMDYSAALKACKTQKELDDTRKRFGRI